MRQKYLLKIIIFAFVIIGCNKETETVGTLIQGDFNGDGKKEFAKLEYLSSKKIEDNPILYKYSVNFTDKSIKPITLETTYKKIQLVNEGDLNADNSDEISIFYETHPHLPFSGIETRSFSNNKWNYMIPHMIINLGFETLEAQEIQDIVTKKGQSIIYYRYEEPIEFDENFTPKNVKKKIEKIELK